MEPITEKLLKTVVFIQSVLLVSLSFFLMFIVYYLLRTRLGNTLMKNPPIIIEKENLDIDEIKPKGDGKKSIRTHWTD